MVICFCLICDWLRSAQELKSTNQNSKPVLRDRIKRGKKEPQQVAIGFSLVLIDRQSGTKLFSLSQSLAAEFNYITNHLHQNGQRKFLWENKAGQDMLILPACGACYFRKQDQGDNVLDSYHLVV